MRYTAGMHWKQRVSLVIAVAGLFAGCQQRTAERTAVEAKQELTAVREIDSSKQPTPVPRSNSKSPLVFVEPPAEELGGAQLIEETWDAISMQGTRVGYVRTTIARVNEDGRELVQSSSFIRVVLAREGQTTEQAMSFTSWDTAQGELVRFKSR